MKAFDSYVAQLSLLADTSPGDRNTPWRQAVDAALDGQPSDELRRLVPLSERRAAGAFFTGARLSSIVARSIAPTLDADSVVLDPACGAGDLLVACAARLSRTGDIPVTDWGPRLVGRDLHKEFVQAAQIRLFLKSARLGLLGERQRRRTANAEKFFSSVQVGCGLGDRAAFRRATHIVLNPPFTPVVAPPHCSWGQGQINSAAMFLESCLAHATPGTRVVAILPDVLRGGWRYRKWRALISNRSRIVSINRRGRFARWADVHVFTLHLIVRPKGKRQLAQVEWDAPAWNGSDPIASYFNVAVGPVVHYRDPHRGRWVPYLVSRNLPAWSAIESVGRRRRFNGRLSQPPFVAVRRTSRPEHPHRAVATLVLGQSPVAVDNHLLVLTPKDGEVRSCRALIQLLRHRSTDAWLNRRIRCRHLPAKALAELPWTI